MKKGTCRHCGEEIGLTTTATDPIFEKHWLHYDWQSRYDHLPAPTSSEGR